MLLRWRYVYLPAGIEEGTQRPGAVWDAGGVGLPGFETGMIISCRGQLSSEGLRSTVM
jgi:hypothetical protein